jgi:hypothetical protein
MSARERYLETMQVDPVGEGFINFRMNPKFEEKVLEHMNGQYY